MPGFEGRAGMVSIYERDSSDQIDVNKLAIHDTEQLPHFARPLFLRIIHQHQKWDLVTSTLKHRKIELQR